MYEQFFHVSLIFYARKAIWYAVCTLYDSFSILANVKFKILVGVSDFFKLHPRLHARRVRLLQDIEEFLKMFGIGRLVRIKVVKCLNENDFTCFRFVSKLNAYIERSNDFFQIDLRLDLVDTFDQAPVKKTNNVHEHLEKPKPMKLYF